MTDTPGFTVVRPAFQGPAGAVADRAGGRAVPAGASRPTATFQFDAAGHRVPTFEPRRGPVKESE